VGGVSGPGAPLDQDNLTPRVAAAGALADIATNDDDGWSRETRT
jgi:hypothetical protein